jgi:acyl-CoA reductase-like NAD-dependent aldehyde dehydrogenase
MAPKTPMGRAVVVAQKKFRRFWHQLSFEERHQVLQEVEREMREDIIEPRNTREFQAMKAAAGTVRLGGLAGGVRGEHMGKRRSG